MLAEIILTHCWSPIVWKNNYALTTNFEFSDFLALDFDSPGDETLEEINNNLQDHRRIIATTRNHQKEKKGVICDRFRLIIPWDKRITSIKEYQYNYELVLKKYPWADRSCVDGARFFFPSREIIYIDRESEYTWTTSTQIENTLPISPPNSTIIDGKIPNWCLNFINHGYVFNGSRNLKILSVARELFRQGFEESSIRRLLLRAPIDWHGVNLEAIIKSAKKKESYVRDEKTHT